jgi:DNA-directed RNA polymerase subunit RPC12/RpoP
MSDNCSRYEFNDNDSLPPHQRLCRCPNCQGFLPSDFPLDAPFKCKKCGVELLVMPDHDDESGEEMEMGRICPISEAKK